VILLEFFSVSFFFKVALTRVFLIGRMMFMLEKNQNKSLLKKKALELEFSLYGVADITGIREKFYLDKKTISRFDRAISLGKRLLDSILDDIKDQPTPLYLHHYRQLNFFLDRQAFSLSSFIQELGFMALPVPASQILDWKKHIGHVSHKHVGELAGLGWIGRNNLLINPELGAKFRLVTILTDMPLEPDRPLSFGCGDCRACLLTCPADAIKETQEEFDHMACYNKLEEFRRAGIVGQHICGVCVKACPGNLSCKYS
jgi:epoxyqueuosine reductase QueG